MYQNGGISTNKMLTVATQAAPAEVEITGVYNVDGNQLAATNITKHDFYYLFRVKDQYGNYMTASQVTLKENLYVNYSAGMTNVKLADTLQTITVDGVNYLGLAITQNDTSTSVTDGTVTVMIMPGGSGKTVTDEITIGKGNSVSSLTISVPGAVPKNGSLYLEYVALDENGNDVTDYRVLKEVKTGDSRFNWIKEDGKVVLKYIDDGKAAAGSSVSAVFTLPNYTTKLVTVNIADPVHPASISGLDSSVAKATRTGDTVSIPVTKINLQDQYGNTYGNSNLWDGYTALAGGEIAIMVVDEDDNNKTFTTTTGTETYVDANGDAHATAYVLGRYASSENEDAGTANEFVFTGHATTTGTENETFKLVQYDAEANETGAWVDYETSSYTGATTNNTQVGAFTTTLTNTENKRFVSYDVNTIDSLYSDASGEEPAYTTPDGYEQTVTVYGVLSNGEKVKLTVGDDFKVNDGDYVTASDNKIEANGTSLADYFKDNAAATSVTGKYSVVINYTGDTINKTVKIDRTTPTTATLKFTDGTQKGINIKANELDGAVAKFASYLTAKDSYGVDATIADNGKTSTPSAGTAENIVYTVSDIDSEKGEVAGNGTNEIAFSNFVAGDSFTLTCTVGTATFSTVVSVQASAAITPEGPEAPVSDASGTYSLERTNEGSAEVVAVPGVFKLKITTNFAVNDTITVGETTLTAKASDASTNEFDIAVGDIAGTITNIVTELNKVTAITDVYEVTSEASTEDSSAIDTLVITQKTASKTENILTSENLKTGDAGTVQSVADCDTATEITEAAAAVPEEYTFTLTKLFVAGDTITIDGTTLTAVESDAGENQFAVGADLNAQATNIAAALGSSTTSFDVTDGGSDVATFTLTQQTYAADTAPAITTGITAE